MIALKKILVPTDFSEPAANALKYAKALAENFGASLRLLHVIEETSLDYFAWTSPMGAPVMTSMRGEMEKNVQKRLDEILSAEEKKRYFAETTIVVGSPFLEIVRLARAEEIDLIVIGTHGRGPISHMLMGSVAEKVVRKAPCPVLSVRATEHEFVMP